MQTTGKILCLATEKECPIYRNTMLLTFGGIQKIQWHWGPLIKAFMYRCIASSHCFTTAIMIFGTLMKQLGAFQSQEFFLLQKKNHKCKLLVSTVAEEKLRWWPKANIIDPKTCEHIIINILMVSGETWFGMESCLNRNVSLNPDQRHNWQNQLR